MKKNSKDHSKSPYKVENEYTMNHTVTIDDFARSVGTDFNDIPVICRNLVNSKNFKYRIIEGQERDKLIVDILKKIDSDQQIVGAKEREQVWENGWKENLNDFVSRGHDLSTLTPKFIRAGQPIRLCGKYIQSENPNFELDYYSIFRQWLFNKYMRRFNTIYEFGCGTGFNLVELAKLFPEKKYRGLDFVNSSKEIVDSVAKVYKWNLNGHVFNMIFPDKYFEIESGSLIFSIGAIEQLAGKFEAFLQFLLAKRPELCVHVEPIIELYDENVLFDYLAIMFHKKRGYTQGLLPRLEELETQGKIKIEKVKRLYFGSLFMEGYSYIVWRPL